MSSHRNVRKSTSGEGAPHSRADHVRFSGTSITQVAEIHLCVDSDYILLPPERDLAIDAGLCKKLAAALVTRYSPDDPRMKISIAVASKYVPASVRQWGQVCIRDGGDRFKCRALLKGQRDTRDCTYVKVSIYHLPIPHQVSTANCKA